MEFKYELLHLIVPEGELCTRNTVKQTNLTFMQYKAKEQRLVFIYTVEGRMLTMLALFVLKLEMMLLLEIVLTLSRLLLLLPPLTSLLSRCPAVENMIRSSGGCWHSDRVTPGSWGGQIHNVGPGDDNTVTGPRFFYRHLPCRPTLTLTGLSCCNCRDRKTCPGVDGRRTGVMTHLRDCLDLLELMGHHQQKCTTDPHRPHVSTGDRDLTWAPLITTSFNCKVFWFTVVWTQNKFQHFNFHKMTV